MLLFEKRVLPLTVSVNTINNKHLYYTCLFKPIDQSLFGDDDRTKCDTNRAISSFYLHQKDLNDYEFLDLFERMIKVGYKLVDMKAYRDVNSVTKFSAIWAKTHGEHSKQHQLKNIAFQLE